MSGLGGMMTAPNTVAPTVTAEPTGRWIIEDEEDYVTPPPEFWEDPFKMPILNNRLVIFGLKIGFKVRPHFGEFSN